MYRILIPVAVLLLSGCASMGANKFSCGAPDGARCQSLRQVYDATDSDDYRLSAAKTTRSSRADDADDSSVDLERLLATSQDLPASQLPAAVPTIETDMPLRSRSKVLRVWIAPYEDGRGDLHSPGHVFMEIEPRRWTVGGPGRDARTIPQPVQVSSASQVAGGQPAAVRPGSRVESGTRNQAVNRRNP